MNLWLAVIAIGIGGYLFRLSFIAIFHSGAPPALERALVYVAPAVLAAIVLPAVVLIDGTLELSPAVNPRALAALLGGLAAWRLRSIAATVVVGMAALWVLEALL